MNMLRRNLAPITEEAWSTFTHGRISEICAYSARGAIPYARISEARIHRCQQV